jgi:transcriptional regulator with XRE-family HTH domain
MKTCRSLFINNENILFYFHFWATIRSIAMETHTDTVIGVKLRQRRHSRGLTLAALAELAGLSVGLLSQIERGLTAPSLRSLQQICAAMEMPVGWLFEASGGEASDVVVRAGGRRRMDLGPGAMVKELLTPDAVLEIQMIRIIIEPGGSSADVAYNNPRGAKCGTVTAGQLGLEVSGCEYILSVGDSFAFKAEEMHRFWCVGDVPVDLLWVVTPALY